MGVLAGLPTVCYLAASTMADTKGANISRMVLKQAGRAKEKILQNLGKSDKTNGSGHSYDIPAGTTTDNLPPGVLYQVKAAYKYQAEDMDELQFEVGEVIDVVEYEEPDEQEEGWLMGVRSSTGQKGLFPANFTRPI